MAFPGRCAGPPTRPRGARRARPPRPERALANPATSRSAGTSGGSPEPAGNARRKKSAPSGWEADRAAAALRTSAVRFADEPPARHVGIAARIPSAPGALPRGWRVRDARDGMCATRLRSGAANERPSLSLPRVSLKAPKAAAKREPVQTREAFRARHEFEPKGRRPDPSGSLRRNPARPARCEAASMRSRPLTFPPAPIPFPASVPAPWLASG